MTQHRQHGRAEIGRPLWRSPNRVTLTTRLQQHQISEKADRLHRDFTIWVKQEQRTHRVVIRGVTNVHAAIQLALKEAAQSWDCDPKNLSVYGIAEGDITDLDLENSSD